MIYTKSKQAKDSKFAGGLLIVQPMEPGYDERISYVKDGKEAWHALVPTVHGRSGMLREHRFFPIAEDYLLVASDYEHYRGGHTDTMAVICNSRGVCFTERVVLRDPILVGQQDGKADSIVILESHSSPRVQDGGLDFILGWRVRFFDLARRTSKSISLQAPSEEVQELLGISLTDMKSQVWDFDMEINSSKSGAYYIGVTAPERSHRRLKLDLQRVLRDTE